MTRSSLAAFAASVAVISIPAIPADAQTARPASPQSRLCVKAAGVRQVVVKRHGSRAPGRNICRRGLRFLYHSADGKHRHWATREATAPEKAKYVRALRALIAPAPGGLTRTAVLPTVPPAGTLSPGVQLPACTWVPESGGNYGAYNPSGAAGKYQIMPGTWQRYGGSGSSALGASPAEQDAVAARIYAAEGGRPWVNC